MYDKVKLKATKLKSKPPRHRDELKRRQHYQVYLTTIQSQSVLMLLLFHTF